MIELFLYLIIYFATVVFIVYWTKGVVSLIADLFKKKW